MENKTVVLDYLKAADSSDFTTLEKLFGPKHRFHSPMSPVPMDTEGRMGMMKAFHDGFSDTNHELLDIFESGDKVVIRGVWHATHTGEFNKIPASGNNINLPFISIIEVQNNEMVAQYIEMDSMTMLSQMGALQVPATSN